MLKKKPQDISFESGIVHFYREKNTAAPGDKPNNQPVYMLTLRYSRGTVGITRYYTAMQNSQKIDEVIRCPIDSRVRVGDIAEITMGGERYNVRQVQYPQDTAFAVMDISLERLGVQNETK